MVTPTAAAQDPPPAVAQYTEQIPSTGDAGAAPPESEAGPSGGGLPPTTERAIDERGGSAAGPLKTLATSPRYGPVTTTPATGFEGGASPAPATENPVSAALDAASSGNDSRVVALLIALITIASLGVVAAGVRLRGRGRT